MGNPTSCERYTTWPPLYDLPRRKCALTFHIEGSSGESRLIELKFIEVTAFKCTYPAACTADMFDSAYGKLVDLGRTAWLESTPPSPGLKHLMICFDDGPCYEFLCLEYSVAD